MPDVDPVEDADREEERSVVRHERLDPGPLAGRTDTARRHGSSGLAGSASTLGAGSHRSVALGAGTFTLAAGTPLAGAHDPVPGAARPIAGGVVSTTRTVKPHAIMLPALSSA